MKEIKAPVIEGFEQCTRDEWNNLSDSSSRLNIWGGSLNDGGHDIDFYYRRIPERPKSNDELTTEFYKFHGFNCQIVKNILDIVDEKIAAALKEGE